jgi:hypothetical protein
LQRGTLEERPHNLGGLVERTLHTPRNRSAFLNIGERWMAPSTASSNSKGLWPYPRDRPCRLTTGESAFRRRLPPCYPAPIEDF